MRTSNTSRARFISSAGSLRLITIFLVLFNGSRALSMCNGYASHYHKEFLTWYFDDQRLETAPGFKVLDQVETPCVNGTFSQFAVDDIHAYYRGKVISGADHKTFAFISGEYSKDNVNVYYRDEKIKEAEVASFVPLKEHPLAVDSAHVFYEGKMAQDANPKGKIEVINGNGQYLPPVYWADGKKFFYKTKFLPNASKSSFSALNGVVGGKDETYYFFSGEAFKKSDCPRLGKYILQCGKELYQVLSINSSFKKLKQLDVTSFHWLGTWKSHCPPWVKGTELYQDSNGVYLANDVQGLLGVHKFADLKMSRRFSAIDLDLVQLICKTTNYVPVE